MNLISPSASHDLKGLVFSDDTKGLSKFLSPSTAAAIWRKEMPAEVRTWLGGLAEENLPQGRVIMPAKAAQNVALELFDMAQMSTCDEREWLEKDIVELSLAFANLMSSEFLRLRLAAVTTNSCRKFHLDAISARLICTYHGTGTQYGIANGKEDPQQIYTVPAGHPMLLRGSIWPAQPSAGLVHRSPPIEGTGETRLVLVLDPIQDPEREARGDQIFN